MERANATVSNRQAQGLKAGLLYEDAKVWSERVQILYRQAEELYQKRWQRVYRRSWPAW